MTSKPNSVKAPTLLLCLPDRSGWHCPCCCHHWNGMWAGETPGFLVAVWMEDRSSCACVRVYVCVCVWEREQSTKDWIDLQTLAQDSLTKQSCFIYLLSVARCLCVFCFVGGGVREEDTSYWRIYLVKVTILHLFAFFRLFCLVVCWSQYWPE